MTTVNISTTNRFVYKGYGSGEIFCNATGPSITNVILYLMYGYNASATDAWIQLYFDISAGSVPYITIPVPAGQNFSWEPAGPGFNIQSATARWRISSTGPTYTAAALNFWVNAAGRAICSPLV